MNDPILMSLFPKLESLSTSKKNNFTKDLFTKKLGYKVNFEFNSITNKHSPFVKRPNFFKNISTFPKSNSNSNIINSFHKENNLSKISFGSNYPSFSYGTKRNSENNKQIGNSPFDYTFNILSTKNKKDVKKLLENTNNGNNINKNLNNKFNKSKTDVDINNKIGHLFDNKEKEKEKIFEPVNTFKNNNSNNNIATNSVNSHIKNSTNKNDKKSVSSISNSIYTKNHSIHNNAKIKADYLTKNNNNKRKEENNKGSIEKKSITKINEKNKNQKNEITKKENKSKILIKSFYEDFIEIINIYESYKEYITAINDFNETYFYLFKINSFPTNINMNIKFLETYKYSSILIICLIFLSKDENLYKENTLKIKELLLKYIYISINSIDYKSLESSKINFFVEKNKLMNHSQNATLIDNLNEIINLLFLEKMNEYKKIRKCLKQLANNIDNLNYKKIFQLLNKSILYCHNYQYIKEEEEDDKKMEEKKEGENAEKILKTESSIKTEIVNTNTNEENKDNNIDYNDKNGIIYNKDNNEDNEDNTNNKENSIKPPFIKEKMSKKFCLVLDLDETIIHNMNLPFGDYFFVRPGFFELIKKVKDFYEIIIFTERDKKFVDYIMNIIDCDKYIDYTLYKNHVIYEEKLPIKKFELIGRNLDKIVYVDNSEISAKYNKKNLYKISSWYNDIFDNELITLKESLINIANSGKFDEDITKGINN